MRIYRVAVCDDNDTMREELSALCRQILTEDNIEYELTEFAAAGELEEQLNADRCPFDLLILDIKMDGMTGIELARSLRARNNRVSIIFVTAYEDYLPDGYSVQPVHFLLKPVQKEMLADAIHTDLKLNHLPKTAVLRIGNKILHLPIADIKYAESYNHNVVIHQSRRNDSYYISLTELEKQLPSGYFARCHNSYIVNLNEVQKIERKELHLKSGEVVPVGRAYYQAFQSAFVRYINQ